MRLLRQRDRTRNTFLRPASHPNICTPFTELPQIAFALTKIRGIGRRFSHIVCKRAGIDLVAIVKNEEHYIGDELRLHALAWMNDFILYDNQSDDAGIVSRNNIALVVDGTAFY